MRRRHLLIEMGLLVIAVGAAIVLYRSGWFRPSEPSTHVIEPSVVEATITVGGVPVAVHVELRGFADDYEGNMKAECSRGSALMETDTGIDGRVRFDGVSGAGLSLHVVLPDGRSAEMKFDAPEGTPRRLAFAIPGIVSGLPIEVRVASTERVKEGDRLSILWDHDDKDEIAPIAILASRETDGRLLVPRLPDGGVQVDWLRPGQFRLVGDVTHIAADTEFVELAIGRRDSITGVARRTDGSPAAGVDVIVAGFTPADGRFVAHSTSDDRGEFAFDALAPAGRRAFLTYVFGQGFCPVWTVIRTDAPAPTTPCRPILTRAASLRARVRTPDGRPIEGVRLHVGQESAGFSGDYTHRGPVRTGADGWIRVTGIPPGSHPVRVAGPDWVSPADVDSRPRMVAFREAVEETVELTAVPARFLRGSVRDPSGGPVEGARVIVKESGKTGSRLGMPAPEVIETDLDGTFVLRRVPFGVDVQVIASGRGYARFEKAITDREATIGCTLSPETPPASPPMVVPKSVASSTDHSFAVIWRDEAGRRVEDVHSQSWEPGSTDEGPGYSYEVSEPDGLVEFATSPGEPLDLIGVVRSRPVPLVGYRRIVGLATGSPPVPATDVVLGAPDPAHVHLIVVDGLDGTAPRDLHATLEGGVKTMFDAFNGIFAFPVERLKGATLVIESAKDEWGFPADIVPMRIPIDVSRGVTRVQLLRRVPASATPR